MTFKKPGLAALAAVATLTAGMTIADTASAQNWRGGRGTSWSFSIGQGPAYGYGGYYGGRGWNRGRGAYGWNGPYYGGRNFYGGRPYYAPRAYYRGPGRFRGCDRWIWDGWRQTYVLVRGRC